MRHEESTEARSQDEPEPPRGLMALRFPTGLGVSFTPDESDLNGSVTYGHDRMTQLVAELFRRTGSLSKHTDQLANFVQPMISREEYEAMLSDIAAAQGQVAILFDVQTKQAQAINDVLALLAGRRAA